MRSKKRVDRLGPKHSPKNIFKTEASIIDWALAQTQPAKDKKKPSLGKHKKSK